MLFSQVVGQHTAKQGILNMWHNAHLPHALLIAGNEGTGGLPFAFALAQFIFCTGKSQHDSCGKCPDCQKVSRMEHADLHISFPSVPPKPGTKAMSRHYIQEFREFFSQTPYGTLYEWLQFIDAENKQGNITAEECREVIDTLNLKSYEGGKKVQIIWRPEYLGKEGNILLKLIEEPPAGTVILFVAEDTDQILPTIISRTQLVRLSPIPAQQIAEALVQRSLADERKALQIAHLANGSFTGALGLLRHAAHDLFPEVRNWFNGLFTNNAIIIARFAEEWSKAGREQQKNFLHYVIQLLEQTLRVMYLPGVPPALPHEETQFVQKLAARGLSFAFIQKMVKHISETIYFIERNAHSRTQLHALSIKLVHIIQEREIEV